MVIRLLNKGSIALKGEQYGGFSYLLNILYIFHSSEDLAVFIHTVINKVRSDSRYSGLKSVWC